MKKLHKVLALLCVSAVAASAGAFAACTDNTPKHDHNEHLTYVSDNYDTHHGECSEDDYKTEAEAHDWGTDKKCTKCGQDKKTAVSSVVISGDDTVQLGETITLTATVTPDDATFKTVTWAIKSGADYAEINATTGVLTAKAAGTVTVTATADGVSGEKTVTVTAEANLALAQDYAVLENGVDESGEKDDISSLEIGLNYTGTKAVTATLSDPEIAEVTVAADKSSVTLTAKKVGKATLTVTDGEKTDTMVVEVATYGLVYGFQSKDVDGETVNYLNVSDSSARTSGEVYIPAYYWDVDEEAYLPVTEVAENGFKNSNVTSVYLGDNVVTVQQDAFNGSASLKSITTGAALKLINHRGFQNCSSLDTVNWAEDGVIQEIGQSCFLGTAFTEIVLPASITKLNSSVFNGCANLVSCKILGEVTTIWGGSFQCCLKLRELWLPATITTIESLAFYFADTENGWVEIDIEEPTTLHFAGTREQWNNLKANGIGSSANTFFNEHNKNLTVICADDAE